MAETHVEEEHFDVLTKAGVKTGITKPRGAVHRDGDYHRAVHVWIYAESTQELLLQRRADCKDSWPGFWDISSAGHVSAGDSSLITARRELHEELGVILPGDAFELLFVFLHESVTNGGKFINNEFADVYLVTTLAPIPLDTFTLQESEVSAVKYMSCDEYKIALAHVDSEYVPYDVNGQYVQLFDILAQRYKGNMEARSLTLEKQLRRYAPISLTAELTGLSKADMEVLNLLIKAAVIMDDIFHQQVWFSNPSLRNWLKQHAHTSDLVDRLKWQYFKINKSPWSCLDENEAFLTTADSAVKLLPEATKAVAGWNGLEYKAAFPLLKPSGANFYPPDMDKMEFELWKNSLLEEQQQTVTDFFNVIKRKSEFILDSSLSSNKVGSPDYFVGSKDLYSVPFSQEYKSFLTKAAELLHKAGDVTNSPSLKRLLHSKGDAFISNDFYESDIAWMELNMHSKYKINKGDEIRKELEELKNFGRENEVAKNCVLALYCMHDFEWIDSNKTTIQRLQINNPKGCPDSKLDVTIGPYETYEDALFGYKATFEAFIGVRDDHATSQLKLFGDHLQLLEENLPMDDVYKSKDVIAAPIRVIQLVYNAGDVKGPQTVAFNLPNDERIVKDRGTSMVMLKNVSEAKFEHILLPIADICVAEEYRKHVDFDSFFTHTICHECCHGIGPHSIILPNGQRSTVRLELQELHSSLEEAKADIVGLWALKYLINQGLLPSSLLKSMYVSFLAGCFRSIRFGLQEAHGKGQALQFNWLFEKGAFKLHSDGTFSVDFDKVEGAVESLSREILTIQAKGDKDAAKSLLQKYGILTEPLKAALQKLEEVQVPVDIAPTFPIADKILNKDQ